MAPKIEAHYPRLGAVKTALRRNGGFTIIAPKFHGTADIPSPRRRTLLFECCARGRGVWKSQNLDKSKQGPPKSRDIETSESRAPKGTDPKTRNPDISKQKITKRRNIETSKLRTTENPTRQRLETSMFRNPENPARAESRITTPRSL